MRVGVISDTHGLLRPEAVRALRGVGLLVHAGDIGSAEILERLREIAPLVAVRGNNDRGAWAAAVPETTTAEVAGRRIYVLHDRKQLDLDPAAAGIDVVVSGHSHKPGIERIAGCLYLNPGSAGPRRFSLPISVALLTLDGRGARARIIELQV
jgi:putative phosphoesterase